MKNSPSKDVATKRAEGLAREWPELASSKQYFFVRNILRRVTVSHTTVWIEIDKANLVAALLEQNPESFTYIFKRKPDVVTLTSNFQAYRQRGEIRIIAPHVGSGSEGVREPSLVKAVSRARDWYERIVSGEFKSIGHLAQHVGLTRRYVRRIVQCAILSPRIIEALLMGQHSHSLTLKQTLRGVPLHWREQEKKILRPI